MFKCLKFDSRGPGPDIKFEKFKHFRSFIFKNTFLEVDKF